MIYNLEEKLKGTIPINREELFILVNSWGRKRTFDISFPNITIHQSEPKECYDLSNLDVSNIEDLTDLFRSSLYNGNLSNWNVSNCKYMKATFYESDFNNDSLKNWDVSNVSRMDSTFKYSIFNGDLSNWHLLSLKDVGSMFSDSKFNNNSISQWDVSKIENTELMFYNSEFNEDISNWVFNKNLYAESMFARGKFSGDISKWNIFDSISPNLCVYKIFADNKPFEEKYNDNWFVPITTIELQKWYQDNKLKIMNVNISKEDILNMDDYLNSFNNELEINKL